MARLSGIHQQRLGLPAIAWLSSIPFTDLVPAVMHHRYLLTGIGNFLQEHGKIALIASEDGVTQAAFETLLESTIVQELACEVVHMDFKEGDDELALINPLLAKITVLEASRPDESSRCETVVFVKGVEAFTPERFAVFKDIVARLSGLPLRWVVSVTTDFLAHHPLDILGKKIAYWYVPPWSQEPALASDEGPVQPATEPATPEPVEAVQATQIVAGSPDLSRAGFTSAFKPASWSVGRLAVTGILLVGVLYGLVSLVSPKTPRAGSQKTAAAPAPPVAVAAPSVDPAARPVETEQTPSPQEPAVATALVAPVAAPSKAIDPAPVPAPVPVSPPTPVAPKLNVFKSVTDCREDNHSFPVATPVYISKETSYIFIKSPVGHVICVAADGGAFRLYPLQADKGIVVNGVSAWRIISPEIKKLEVFVQGVRVKFDPSVVNAVQVVKKI
jgi:hypothetical protein